MDFVRADAVEAITEFEAAVKKGGDTSRAEQRVKTALDGFDLELRALPDVAESGRAACGRAELRALKGSTLTGSKIWRNCGGSE